MLWRALGHVAEGFYIDVGAADPDELSVTRLFYDLGWHGINVEPSADYFDRLAAARTRDLNLRIGLAEAPGERTFYRVKGTGLSTMSAEFAEEAGQGGWEVEETRIPTRTLAEICEQHARTAEIHFLKIDVEGAEAEVLAGADFARFRPWVVLVEATSPLSTVETFAEWEPGLLRSDYRFAWFDGLNRFYLAAERWEALHQHFRVQPNVFDDFVVAAHGNARHEAQQLKAELAGLQGHLGGLDPLLAQGRDQVKNLEHALGQERAHLRNVADAIVKEAEHARALSQILQEETGRSHQLEEALRQDIDRFHRLEAVRQEQADQVVRVEFALRQETDRCGHLQERLDSELARAHALREATTKQREQILAGLQQAANLAAELSRVLAWASTLEYRLRAVYRSHSWRLTRPIRSLSWLARASALTLRGRPGFHLAGGDWESVPKAPQGSAVALPGAPLEPVVDLPGSFGVVTPGRRPNEHPAFAGNAPAELQTAVASLPFAAQSLLRRLAAIERHAAGRGYSLRP